MIKNLSKVIIEIDTNNSAFEDNGKIEEVKRIISNALENGNFTNENDFTLRCKRKFSGKIYLYS